MKGEAYSFSGGWRTASKVVLCGVMLRGRHRGLPVALDRAVRLPGWEEGGVVRERGMGMWEEEDRVLKRGVSRGSAVSGRSKGMGRAGI